MEEPRGVAGGTVVRGADGSLYFIRDEVLEAFKMEGEPYERAQELLKDARQAERPAEGVAQLRYVRGEILPKDPEDRAPDMMAASTYMCPWFCRNTPS